MNYSELAPAYIRAIAPYQAGKPISELERELGITGIVKLASNENPLGASPRAIAAARAALDEIGLYPDGNGFALKDALAKRYGVIHAQVVLGNGSNDLLELSARAFLTVGRQGGLLGSFFRRLFAGDARRSAQSASASRPRISAMIWMRCAMRQWSRARR